MSGIKNKRVQNFEKPFPGCMGRMVNLFDFGPGVPGNRLLADKAHLDGSVSPGNQEGLVRKVLDPTEDQTENRGCELRRSSNKKSSGTPMKMLIAREMLKETESKQKPPNVVAKLMGLDTLPGQQHNLTSQRSCAKAYSQNTLSPSRTTAKYWPQESAFLDKQMQFESPTFQEQQKYKDAYNVWHQSPTNNYKDNLPQRGRHKEQLNETKMELVRQKFIQAKRLATDERLRQSKEFQDALEVLSSNKDLFLKFLQEPNSLFSQHLYELQSIPPPPPPPQTNCITVLRPSKTIENTESVGHERNSDKRIQRPSQAVETNGWDKSKPPLSPLFSNQKDYTSTQPTRIVVLKPSPGKTHDIKAVVSSPTLSPRLLQSNDLYEELDVDDEARCSREVAKEITRQMRESLSGHRREETLLSSVFSSGYVGDESSFNMSENEYAGEGNLGDLEVMTPTSRHSWDYINRFGSPHSSSFSRASYSPESSVCREAKKRLSERWALMSSNCSSQEQRQVRRSSSTLAEMLALSETKKCIESSEEGMRGLGVSSSRSYGCEPDLKEPTSCLSSGREKDEVGVDSPKNLLRSRSVPVSSTAYGSRLNVEVPDYPEIGKSDVPKELEKSKSGKSSFKGKVSSLFFSRNKKLGKEKSKASIQASLNDKCQPAVAETGTTEKLSPCEARDKIPQSVTKDNLEGAHSLSPGRSSDKASLLASTHVELKQGAFSHEVLFSLGEPGMHGNQRENQDQPSPISVLEASFEDENSTPPFNEAIKTDLQGSPVCLKSNFISKSPPIESLARSLSWDDVCSDSAIPDSLNSAGVSSELEEQEWFSFVQSLLSSVGLDCSEVSDAVYVTWHSPETPLDPSLLDKFINLKEDKELRYEAKRRQRRSNQKLIFDCVNAALVDILGYELNSSLWTKFSCGAQARTSSGASVTVEEVWSRVRGWFFGEPKCFQSECGDFSLLVESMVKQEVVDGWRAELMRSEVDGLGTQIEGKMLEELVEEALFELTGCFC